MFQLLSVLFHNVDKNILRILFAIVCQNCSSISTESNPALPYRIKQNYILPSQYTRWASIYKHQAPNSCRWKLSNTKQQPTDVWLDPEGTVVKCSAATGINCWCEFDLWQVPFHWWLIQYIQYCIHWHQTNTRSLGHRVVVQASAACREFLTTFAVCLSPHFLST